MSRLLHLAACLVVFSPITRAQVIIPFQHTWDYLATVADDGSGRFVATNPFLNSSGVDFTTWAQTDFDTTIPMTTGGRTIVWQNGPAPFGYNYSALGSELILPDQGERDATHYFRHEFVTTEQLTNLSLHVIVDDGAVFYLDGQRISSIESCCNGRNNVLYDPTDTPNDPIPFRELSSVSNGPCRIEGVVYAETFPEIELSPGKHVLAASVHSISANSADMQFDARLSAYEINEFQGRPEPQNDGSFSAPWHGRWDRGGNEHCQTDSSAWTSGIAPNGPGTTARLLRIPTRATTIFVDYDTVLGTLVLDNIYPYAIAGQGTFLLDGGSNPTALIEVLSGRHEFQTQVRLRDPLEVRVVPGSIFEFNNDVFQDDNAITITGGGTVEFNNRLVGGVVNVALASTLSGGGEIHGVLNNAGGTVSPGNGIGTLSVLGDFLSQGGDSVLKLEIGEFANDLLRVSGELQLQGTLQVALMDGFSPVEGDTFTIFQSHSPSLKLDQIELAELGNGLSWDISRLPEGRLSVVPEPNGLQLLLIALLGIGGTRRFRKHVRPTRHHIAPSRVTKVLTSIIGVVACFTMVSPNVDAGSPTLDTTYVNFGSVNVSYLHPSLMGLGEADGAMFAPNLSTNQPDFNNEWYLPEYEMSDVVFANGVTVPWQNNASLPIGFGQIRGFDTARTGHEGLATDIGVPESGEIFTTYIRMPFHLSETTTPPLVLEYLVDDGMDVYLDGRPWARVNCCQDQSGLPVDGSAYESLAFGVGNESTLEKIAFVGNIPPGDHLLAIALHPSSPQTSDLGLDFRIYTPGNYRNWIAPASGDWTNTNNWELGMPPDGDFAVFDSDSVFNSEFGDGGTVVLDSEVTVEGIQFEGSKRFNIAGTGTIHFDGTANRQASLNVLRESHEFQLKLKLADDLETEVVARASIDLNNEVDFNGNGIWKVGGGDLIIDNKQNVGPGSIAVWEGVLGGIGIIPGDVHVDSTGAIAPAGLVAPVDTATTLTINGSATIEGGTVRLNIYGNRLGDAVSGGGAGKLSLRSPGQLHLELASDYTPAHGDTIGIFPNWETIEGSLHMPPDWSFNPTTGEIVFGFIEPNCDLDGDSDCDLADIDSLLDTPAVTSNQIEQWLAEAGSINGLAGPFLVGDTNLDGVVDPQDLNQVGQHWLMNETSWSSGDFNGDNRTDAQDLNAIGRNWLVAVPMNTAVPEPSSSALLMCAVIGLGLFTKKRIFRAMAKMHWSEYDSLHRRKRTLSETNSAFKLRF